MRICVAAPSPVPFRRGGAERLWEGLVTHLNERTDHAAELIKLPVRELNLPDLVEGYAAFAALDLSHFDLVVTGKYPAWAIDHPHHVVWMLHPLRGLYDAYPSELDRQWRQVERHPDPDLAAAVRLMAGTGPAAEAAELIDLVRSAADHLDPDDAVLAVPGPFARAVVLHLDRWALDRRRIRRHVAISSAVATRPGWFPPDATVTVAHPPSNLEAAAPGPYGPDLVTVSRLDPPKRLDVLIEAMAHVDAPCRLLIAGEGPDRGRLERLAAPDPRVELLGAVSDDQLRELYRTARAVPFVPLHEDFGYVALEAMAHARPVVTTTDSGGPAELVADGAGLVVEPTPRSIGAALQRLATDADLAQQLGQVGVASAAEVTWERVVDRLLEPRHRRRRAPRPLVVALSTYPVHPRDGGGSLRAAHLLEGLAHHADVELVSLDGGTHGGDEVGAFEAAPGVAELVVARSARHCTLERRMQSATATISVGDIAASVLHPATPQLTREVDAALDAASAAVLIQPYLAPLLRELRPDLPFVYDAQNHELSLKRSMLPDDEGGRWLLARLDEVEGAAVRGAACVTAVTAHDRDLLATGYGVAPDGIQVVPNGVDTTAVRYTGARDRRSRRTDLARRLQLDPETTFAVFTGSAHGPNVEAGRSLTRLAADTPDVTYLLAGRHTDTLHRRDLPPNVHLLGAVPRQLLDLLLGGADVALNPMPSGGGSNLKLAEYLAAGIPVLTTPVGARGLEGAHDLMLIRPVEGFAQGLATLSAGGDAVAQRTLAARRWVEQHLDWRPLGACFAQVVMAATETPRPPDAM